MAAPSTFYQGAPALGPLLSRPRPSRSQLGNTRKASSIEDGDSVNLATLKKSNLVEVTESDIQEPVVGGLW